MEPAGKTADLKLMQVETAMLGVIEKRQSLAGVFTAFLAVLVIFVEGRKDFGSVLLWSSLVIAVSACKIFLARYRRLKRFKGVAFRTRKFLIMASAASSGILWSLPMTFVDFQNPIELATVTLIISGIISGSVSTYLGTLSCIALLATAPCLSIVAMIALKMTPVPWATIISIVTFYIFILSLSVKTRKNSADLFQAKFENLELIESLETTQDELLNLSNRDDLTGLPNRRLLAELFNKFAASAKRNGNKLAILFIDMDKFKPINDKYGHDVGDKVLIEASWVMKKTLRDADVVARLGGDEFVAILKDINLGSDAILVADKLRRALNTNVIINETTIHISASVGFAMFPDQSESLAELLRLSDASMYTAKGSVQVGD
jgi:diguanylate cyclase (GGDEF)-like protein